jgi:long-subunit fatty acid transport protein
VRARLSVLVAALAVAAPAHAYPLLAPRPIPDAIAGPTDPHVAATLYNPAAMGYLRGLHGFLDGGARLALGSISRDPVNGRDGGSASINFANLDSFAGLVWDLGTSQFAVGLAVYTPFTEISSFPDNSPVRYQERWQRFITLEETLAVAWTPERHISIGAGFIINESWTDLRYARDAAPSGGSVVVKNANPLCGGPCGFENPAAEQDVRLRGFAVGFGFSAGVLVRPVDRVWIGISYTNHQAGGEVALTGVQARVTLPPDTAGNATVLTGDNRVLMVLPESAQAGVRVNVNPQLDVEASFRFVHYGAHTALSGDSTALDVSLQGGNLAAAKIAPEFMIDRGLQNAYAVEVSTRHVVTPTLRLSPSLLFESSAVAANAVSAAALEGNKLDAALTLEWQAWHGLGNHALFIGAHLGVTAYFLGRVNSRFNAAGEVECVDSGFSLAHCGSLDAGSAFPSASGSYTLVGLNMGAAIGFTY